MSSALDKHPIVFVPFSLKEESLSIGPQQCRAARALLGWTQRRLAKEVGIFDTGVHEFESGKRATPNHALMISSTFRKQGLIFAFGGVFYAAKLSGSLAYPGGQS